MSLILVDGPNLYNDVGRYLAIQEPPPRSYFTDWFDIDRLVRATVPEIDRWKNDLGIVLVHSRNKLGESGAAHHLAGAHEVDPFWARQGANPRSSSLLIEIPGSGGKKEAGVDVAIVTYLFETMTSWDLAILFAADADFVPAVWSLRRKGKSILCASRDTGQRGPLVQACQDYRPWDAAFLDADAAMARALEHDGAFDKFLDAMAHKHPRVSVKGGQLIVSSTTKAQFDGNDQNKLRDALKPLHNFGLSPVGGQGPAPSLVLTPGADFPADRAAIVLEGVARQARRSPGARWKQLFS